MRSARLIFALIACAASHVPTAAWADAAKEAAAHLERAEKLKEEGDWAAACPLYEKAYELARLPGALVRMAECAERAGEYDLALDRYAAAEELVREFPRSVKEISAKREALAAKLGVARITTAAPSPDGTQVKVGARVVPIARPIHVLIEVEHEACAEAPGYARSCRRFRVERGAPGGAGVTEVALAPMERGPRQAVPPGPVDAQPPPPPPPDGGRGPLFWGGVASVTIGGVGAVAAAATGAMILDLQAVADEGCADSERRTGCDRESLDAAELGGTLNVVNVVAWGVAIAGLGAGIPMMVVGGGDSGGAAWRLRPFHAGLSIETEL